jgi:membrane protein DedA with SNARE-associated domain
VTQLLLDHGLLILFVLVAMESAGVPLPGETALIAAALLAQRGHYSLAAVIAVAALGAIVGDNIGYWLGPERRARAAREDVDRPRALRPCPPAGGAVLPQARREDRLHRALHRGPPGHRRVDRGDQPHVLVRFFFWNAAGGIAWAIAVGVVAYWLGQAAADAIGRYGLYAAIALGVLLVPGFLAFRFWRRCMLEES